MKKIIMVLAVLLAIGVTLTAVSADDSWSFNFSNEENNGGTIDFSDDKVVVQGIEFAVPEGYKLDEKSKLFAKAVEDIEDAKMTACTLVKDNDQIVIKVIYADDEFNNVTAINENQTNKTLKNINGLYELEDGAPKFSFIKDGKIAQVTAPDEETLEAVIK